MTSMGELVMHESAMRLRQLRLSSSRPKGLLTRLVHWGAWINYVVSVLALAAGITAGWRFADIGFDLMMRNVSGDEVQEQAIRKIPAWILVYKGIKTW